jgi:hypothetical protein
MLYKTKKGERVQQKMDTECRIATGILSVALGVTCLLLLLNYSRGRRGGRDILYSCFLFIVVVEDVVVERWRRFPAQRQTGKPIEPLNLLAVLFMLMMIDNGFVSLLEG